MILRNDTTIADIDVAIVAQHSPLRTLYEIVGRNIEQNRITGN